MTRVVCLLAFISLCLCLVWAGACSGPGEGTVTGGPGEPVDFAEEDGPVGPEPEEGTGVLIATDRQEYREGERIVVTIRNRLGDRVTTYDQQTFCSIVRLEREEERGWQGLRECFSAMPSAPVTLETDSERVVRLPGLVASEGEIGLRVPGTYRATIIFSRGDAFSFATAESSSTSPFNVMY